MHIDEFRELGFSVAWRFPEGTSEEQIDKTVDDFIQEVIEPNKLAFDGSGYPGTGRADLPARSGQVHRRAPRPLCVNGLRTANWMRCASANFSTFGGLSKHKGQH